MQSSTYQKMMLKQLQFKSRSAVSLVISRNSYLDGWMSPVNFPFLYFMQIVDRRKTGFKNTHPELSLLVRLAILVVCFFGRSEAFQETAQPTVKSIRDGSCLVPLRRFERRHLPPEGSALSTELQGLHSSDFIPTYEFTQDRLLFA